MARPWNRFSEQPQPFARKTGLIEKAPCQVSTRLRDASREPSLNGVALQVDRHDRDCARCISCGPESGRANRKKHVYLSLDQISRETRIALRLAASETDFENYRLTLDVAELAQSLSRGIDGSASRADRVIEDTHYGHLP